MSELVYTKVPKSAELSDFDALCERCCWPTLKHGELTHALVYPETAQKNGYWREGQLYMPRQYSVQRTGNGAIGCDEDYADIRRVAAEIYKALNGEVAELPRPSPLFCSHYTLARHQNALKQKGIASELVLEGNEWCLDVEVPQEDVAMEVTLS